MYTPHVTDQDIQHLIHELTEDNQLPSGARLRAELQQRFGSRGGVTRIYRLLTAAHPKPTPRPTPPTDPEKLEREVTQLRESVRLAEHREQAHQSRWALEVDHLRQKLATVEPLAQQAKTALDTAELLRRQLHAAHIRISILEQQLMDNPRSKT